MSLFRYKAIDAEGNIRHGRIPADNPQDLEARLRRMGCELIRGRRCAQSIGAARRQVPRRELIAFCFHLQQLTAAGIPIIDGLKDLRDGTSHRSLRDVSASLVESVTGGSTISEAMAGHPAAFDEVFISLIRAGESSGRLPEVLERIADTLQWEDELIAHARQAFAYPAFVLAALTAAMLFLFTNVVPQLKSFVRDMGSELPLASQTLFLASDLLANHWLLLLMAPLAILSAAALLVRVRPATRFHLDAAALRIPLLGPIRQRIVIARLANTMSLLYASGIPLLDALRQIRETIGNHAIEADMRRIEDAVRDGCSLTGAFAAARLFPPLVIRLVGVGENTGALDEAMSKIGYFYHRDVRETVGRMQRLVEPLLTVLLGGLLAWIMLAVLGPVYDVIGNVGRIGP